jgi:hypothetical protein
MANDQRKKTKRGARLKSGKASPTQRTARPTGKIEGFFGVLAGKTKKVATIEEINQAAQDGWAGKVKP